MPADLGRADAAVEIAGAVLSGAVRELAGAGNVDADQVLAYDVAHAAAGVRAARATLGYGRTGDDEARIACAFVADVLADLAARTVGREAAWGTRSDWLEPAASFVADYRDPRYLAGLCGVEGDRRLDADFALVRETFHRFAEEQLRPRAEEIHRHNRDIPEEVIGGLAEMGAFGLSIPEEYGGFATGGESDYMGMVVATEELSWGSLGAGGSLITRPEILSRALVAGGTVAQKQRWLPALASGDVMNAVAVTEPDFGSDVANIVTSATATSGGWLVNGTKTWCTFAARADVVMLLARTDPDRSRTHRGLSLFIVEKPRGDGHGFTFTQDPGVDGRADPPGQMVGRPIDTIGYRGMHSYEIAFENWFVPGDNLIGADAGVGRGFYLQMAGFENGRLQTAARALGVMQAAYEAAYAYAVSRVVFGRPILEYQLTRAKLARMAVLIQVGAPVLLRSGAADGQGRRDPRGVDAQGLRVPGGGMGHP